MSYIKNALKNARESINAKKYDEAIKNCEKVLQYEADNYNAYVFLGISYLNLQQINESKQAYLRAVEINTSQPLAWQGLANFYEKQEDWANLGETWVQLLKIYNESNDGQKVLDVINKLVDLYTNRIKDRRSLVATLKYYLPSSPYYETIRNLNNLPSQTQILLQIIELLEKDEIERIRQEIETRRKRLDAGPQAIIKAQVENEVYSNSELETFYDSLLEIANDSNIPEINISELSIKYVEHLRKKNVSISSENKQALREKLFKLSQQLVEQDTTSPIPYEILIESTNVGSADEYDINMLEKYSEKFPDTELSKIIRDGNSNSIFGSLVLSWLNHDYKDYELALDYASNGRNLVTQYSKSIGYTLDRVLRSLELCMANCYLNIDSKYHTDALQLYQKILNKDPKNIHALQGVGMILSTQKQFEKSIEIFENILQLDSKNYIAKSEIGWIHFLTDNYEEATKLTLDAIDMYDGSALCFYRLGRIYWAMGDQYRKDKNYAYAQFIQSVKLDSHFAKSFTYLGHYYRIIENDNVRAKKCYQKAFSIDACDEEAGSELSEYFQSEGEGNIAEGIYRTVIQANRKAGWAWKRLGFAELAKGNYLEAITDFQTALRTDTKDIRCWEGLAEAYRHEGRYMASMKAFLRATELDPSSVYAHYQIATIKQKLGMYIDAIDQYNLTLEKAESKGEHNHMPSLEGLGNCYLSLSKEYFHTGFYGRAAESLDLGITIIARAIETNSKYQCFWKLIGDFCIISTLLLNYLHLIHLAPIKNLIGIAKQLDIDAKLHLPKDIDNIECNLDSDEDNLTNSNKLRVILICGRLSYKYAIILSRNRPDTAPAFWYDLGVAYYKSYEHYSKNIEENIDNHINETSVTNYLSVGIRCIKIALKFESTNFQFWNSLGVMTLLADSKISQHAFIKAIEYSPKSPVPWTNLGLLYLLHSDLDLANQAFSTAQSLDPDYAPAWVGQAYVANLWGSNEAAELFEHAYEISGGGHSLEADYGFAYQAFTRYKNSPSIHKSLLISPTFALQKLSEQRPDDAASLNLLGLLFERLNRPDRAVDTFNDVIIAIKKSIQKEQQSATLHKDSQEESLSKLTLLFRRLAYAHGNLGRVLCAAHDFSSSITAYTEALTLIEQQEDGSSTSIISFKIYTMLGAGLAYYFNDELENSLQMFETALNEADNPEQESSVAEVKKDVVVLVSQVLWALGGVEHKNLAKEELFRCISQNPQHLPAIFSLCAIGLLQGDDTLATAALREMVKLPIKVVDKLDKGRDMDFLYSRYFLLQDSPEEATQSLSKSILLRPHEIINWICLSNHLISLSIPFTSTSIAGSAMELISNSISSLFKQLSTKEKAKVYQNYASSLLISRQAVKQDLVITKNDVKDSSIIKEPFDNNENDGVKDKKNKEGNKNKTSAYEDLKVKYEKLGLEALEIAQRAVRIAPWDLVGWSLLAMAYKESV
ncbi:3809_t:CDS:10 [Gigaspora margarita]|uniref:3809_t:CDS:1 n=1 Tax=Gigaspora margarita TaxID=4874 RepID=A0ABM8VXS5_GIGMA|nr:3809_t:CDS:10 [Gigaspora margarita]